MGDDILPADPAGDADDIRADTMGFQPAAQVGRRLGEVAHEVSDGTLLRGDALLRRLFLQLNSFYIRYIVSIYKPSATNLHQNGNKKNQMKVVRGHIGRSGLKI